MKEVIAAGDVNMLVDVCLLQSLYELFHAPRKTLGLFQTRERGILKIDIRYKYDYANQETRDRPPRVFRLYDGRMLMEICLVNDLCGTSRYMAAQCVGYFAHLLSKKYSYYHAAGLILKGKGVLLIGQSGCGKSTLANILGGDVLDDDFLLVSQKDMLRVGRVGYIRRNQDGKWVEKIDDANYGSKLDIIFILNKDQNPDFVRRRRASDITPKLTFDDGLESTVLFDEYNKKAPLAFDVPIFEIGTKGHKNGTAQDTKRAIEFLMNCLM